MRLVSFDVGIKNLAYCIFEVEGGNPPTSYPKNLLGSTPPSKVASWTVANLLEPETPVEIHPCSYELTKKRKSDAPKLCGKVSKYQTPSPSICYFCETHAKKSAEYLLPKKEYTLSKLKNKRIDALQTTCRENGVDCVGLKKQEIAEKLASWYEGRMFRQIGQTAPKKTAGETDLISIGRAIKRVLDADPEIRGATHVIIENQISTIASRMKTIQGMIAQYFIMQDRHIEIEFVSSHNKLKGHKLESEKPASCELGPLVPSCEGGLRRVKNPEDLNPLVPSCEGGLRRVKNQEDLNPLVPSSKYKLNKSDGVAICRQSLNETPHFESWKPMFESSKKKDDLADCFFPWKAAAGQTLHRTCRAASG
jgi:hypothetical protein